MTHNRLRATVAALCLSVTGCARLQPTEAAALCDVINSEIERGRTPSIVIATVDEDGLMFLDAGGVDEPFSQRAATPASVYMLFSITKVFTATAVMTLVDDGALDIDAPLERYMPDLPLENPYPTPLTPRHLLNHSSGLPNPSVWSRARAAGERRPELATLLAQMLEGHGRLTAEPGTQDRYNNLGYLVLGRLIEEISGRPYEDYVRERILDPLEMNQTDFRYRPDMLAHAAIGTVRKNSLYHRLFLRAAPAELFGPSIGRKATSVLYEIDGASYAGLVGTAEDVAKFLSLHLSGGVYRGRRILSERSVEAMQTVQYTSSGKTLSHALGWHTDVVDDVRYFNHMGRGGGFRPAIRIYPTLGHGIVVLTNGTDYDPKPITRRAPIEGRMTGRCAQ